MAKSSAGNVPNNRLDPIVPALDRDLSGGKKRIVADSAVSGGSEVPFKVKKYRIDSGTGGGISRNVPTR
jgi:hypothetical protein